MKKGLLTTEEWLNSPGVTVEEMAIHMLETIVIYRGELMFHDDSNEQSFCE